MSAIPTALVYFGIYLQVFGTDEPAQMNGAMNVAVPAFAASGSLDSGSLERAASRIATNAANNQSEVLKALASDNDLLPESFLVWGPDKIKKRGPASKIADLISADVVIDAILEFDGDITRITPRFYFTGRKFVDADAEELVGLHRLGPSVTANGPPDSAPIQSQLDGDLKAHWAVAAQITLGLDYYRIEDFDKAIELFGAAIETANDNWDERSGAEAFYLYLANALGRNGEIEEAQAAYLDALEINPGYARAQVGLAETIFQLSLGGCSRDQIDQVEMNRAIATLESSRDNSLGTPLTDLQMTKASLLLGRMHLCLFLAEFESSEVGESLFTSVIERIGDLGDLEIRERSRWNDIAAESWAALAVMYSKSEPTLLDLQDEAYANAIELSAVSSRKAVFNLNLASIFLQRQDCTKGRENLDSGIALYLSPDKGFELRYKRIQQEWDSAGCGVLPDLSA